MLTKLLGDNDDEQELDRPKVEISCQDYKISVTGKEDDKTSRIASLALHLAKFKEDEEEVEDDVNEITEEINTIEGYDDLERNYHD